MLLLEHFPAKCAAVRRRKCDKCKNLERFRFQRNGNRSRPDKSAHSCVRHPRRSAASNHREGNPLQVLVRDNNIDQALKALKKKMQREGIFREMKLRGHYEKPSEKRARERAEAIRRYRKLQRKRLQREGLLPK